MLFIHPSNRSNISAGLPKAEYAVGYFTEMGIGTRRDPLEANVWYVKAADDGDGRAKVRIAAIRTAASGGPTVPEVPPAPSHQKAKKEKSARNASGQGHEGEKGKKKWGIF
jgi:TPR repeat protein